jgi:hypothetical protein
VLGTRLLLYIFKRAFFADPAGPRQYLQPFFAVYFCTHWADVTPVSYCVGRVVGSRSGLSSISQLTPELGFVSGCEDTGLQNVPEIWGATVDLSRTITVSIQKPPLPW